MVVNVRHHQYRRWIKGQKASKEPQAACRTVVTPPSTASSIWFICTCSGAAPNGAASRTTLMTRCGRSGSGEAPPREAARCGTPALPLGWCSGGGASGWLCSEPGGEGKRRLLTKLSLPCGQGAAGAGRVVSAAAYGGGKGQGASRIEVISGKAQAGSVAVAGVMSRSSNQRNGHVALRPSARLVGCGSMRHASAVPTAEAGDAAAEGVDGTGHLRVKLIQHYRQMCPASH